MALFTDSPIRQELNKNFLDQVILRFDFPIIFGLAGTDSDGRLITARKSELLQEIRDLLISKLPLYAPVEHKTFNFEFNTSSPKVNEVPQELIHSFKSIDGSKLCEVSINSFVYVSKGGSTYTNFEDFLDEFWSIWEKTAEKLKVPTITKVGLRKINVLPYDDLLEASFDRSIRAEFHPPMKIAVESFIGRQSFEVEGNWKCIYHYGIYPKLVNNKKAYFFDTDIFRDDAVVPSEIKGKLKAINQVHWELYCKGLTPEFFENMKVTK